VGEEEGYQRLLEKVGGLKKFVTKSLRRKRGRQRWKSPSPCKWRKKMWWNFWTTRWGKCPKL
jgi:hypothetical protein